MFPSRFPENVYLMLIRADDSLYKISPSGRSSQSNPKELFPISPGGTHVPLKEIS
jgi:hypothetical protein